MAGHKPSQCRHRDAKCFYCEKVGHLARVCRKKTQTDRQQSREVRQIRDEAQEEVSGEEYALLHVTAPRQGQPLQVHLKLDEKAITMEIDTGASVSLVSETEYNRLWPQVPLEATPIKLRTYSGEPLKVLGRRDVEVSYGQQRARLPLVVVAGDGPCLLGRNWLRHVQLDWQSIGCVQSSSVQDVLAAHAEVFNEELGTLRDYKASIHVDSSVLPKFCKARSVPYAMRDKVDRELDRLVTEGILEPVQYAEWAAPIVPVLKSDQVSVRICGDFKQTVNAAVKVDRYPLPKVEDLFARLAGGKVFSKLDLSQAYQQVLLDEESKRLVTINTQKGLFQYTRLPFGISSAPGIFQRLIESLLQGIPDVVVYLDDILVAGKTETEHLKRLDQVLARLQEAGLRLSKKKCLFMASSVDYLGHRIDAHGLHPLPEKVRAVEDAPAPQDVAQLRSYLGLLSYYSKFLPNLSTVTGPLHQLLSASRAWRWGPEEEKAFQASKQLLVSSQLLVHYDPSLELILSCDASAYGLGAVLSHKLPDGSEKPIAFASRTLSATEKKYAQLEKEGLACVFGVKRFHSYLFGRSFTLCTDHKPLIGLFDEGRAIPAQASARIQRWALTLAAYHYVLAFKTTAQNGNADAMSRLPLPEPACEPPIPAETVLLMEHMNMSPVTAVHIRRWTSCDPVLSRVLKMVQEGWPEPCQDKELQPFASRRAELSVQDGCILWGSKVVIPPPGRKQLLEELHMGHPGVGRMKSLARMFIWWPGIDATLEETVRQCAECQQNRSAPPKAPLHPWEWPSKPWSRLHVDFAGPVHGHMFLVIVDAHSKWVEVFPLKSATSAVVIQCMRPLFARFGLPDTLVSDNATCFVSVEFKQFLECNGIRHITSSPYHPASNGLVERAVQIVKHGLKKMRDGTIGDRLARFLFSYRTTPHTTTGVPPAELLFGRNLQTRFHKLYPNRRDRVEEYQAKQKQGHDQQAKWREFQLGKQVYVRNFSPQGPKWVPAQVLEQTGPVSYKVVLEGSHIVCRRHVDQIRPKYDGQTPVRPLDLDSEIEDRTEEESEGVEIQQDDIHSPPAPAAPVTSRASPDHVATNTERRYPLRDRRPPDRLQL